MFGYGELAIVVFAKSEDAVMWPDKVTETEVKSNCGSQPRSPSLPTPSDAVSCHAQPRPMIG